MGIYVLEIMAAKKCTCEQEIGWDICDSCLAICALNEVTAFANEKIEEMSRKIDEKKKHTSTNNTFMPLI